MFNFGKVEEVRKYFELLGVEVYQLKVSYLEIQVDIFEEVVEYGVKWLVQRVDGFFFFDDLGFFVEVLKGFLGVYFVYVYKMIGYQGILKFFQGEKN